MANFDTQQALKIIQCWFNAGQALKTIGQHYKPRVNGKNCRESIQYIFQLHFLCVINYIAMIRCVIACRGITNDVSKTMFQWSNIIAISVEGGDGII